MYFLSLLVLDSFPRLCSSLWTNEPIFTAYFRCNKLYTFYLIFFDLHAHYFCGLFVIFILFLIQVLTAPFFRVPYFDFKPYSTLTNNSKVSGLRINFKPSMAFMSMFLGFIDGDGYIDIGEQVQQNKKTKFKTRSTIRLAMGIGLDARDLPLLEYFQKILGVGSISAVPNTNKYRLYFSAKSLVTVIVPLIVKYDLQFLVYNRSSQYSLLRYILDNNLKH